MNETGDVRSVVYVEGLAAGLLGRSEAECWYVNELRTMWLAGFRQGRKLAALAMEDEAMKKDNKKLIDQINNQSST